VNVRRILITADTVGGVWTYAVDLARALGEIEIETILVIIGPPPTPAQRATIARLDRVTLIQSDAALDWLARDAAEIAAAGRKIAAIADDYAVDLVQLNSPALAAEAEFAVPVVAVAHSCLASWWEAVETGPLPDDFAWRNALTRAGMVAADAVVAPTHAFATTTWRVHRLPATPQVVHNGRSLPSATAQPQKHYAFTAGRLWDRGKDLATLDMAAATGLPIFAAGPLIGPGGDAIGFNHLTCLGLLDSTTLGAKFAARPVFVSTALYEPFGLAVLEAAQAGCALVLTDIPTFRELWNDAALFVAPRDSNGFAAAIAGLLGNPAERGRRGAAAAAAAQRYTGTAMRDGMVALYGVVARPSKDRVVA